MKSIIKYAVFILIFSISAMMIACTPPVECEVENPPFFPCTAFFGFT